MRILLWMALGMAAGCGLGALGLRKWSLAALGTLALGLSLLLRTKRQCLGRWERILPVLWGLFLGCLVFVGYDLTYLAPARAVDGQVQQITVTASDYSWETDYGTAVDGRITLAGRSYKIRLYLQEQRAIEPGNRITLLARLRFTDEGGSAEPTYHRTNGILLLATQRDEEIIQPGERGIREFPGLLRQKLKQIIEDCLPAEEAALAKGLLLGDKTDLDYDTALTFRLTGLSHVVAVSGLHVSMLFGVVTRLLGRRRRTALVGIPLVLLFAALAGFTPSVTRAAAMQVILMSAMLLRRDYDPPTALAAAVMGMLCWNPLVIASVGFQLSVASVTGIYLCYGPIRDWLAEKWQAQRGLRARVASSCAMSLAATWLTTPLVAWYFGTVSLVGLVANLLVLPLLSGGFYGILWVCLCGAVVPPLGQGLGWCVGWLLRGAMALTKLLAGFPLAAVYTTSGYIAGWLVLCYGLIGLTVWLRPKKLWPGICCGVLGLCMALTASFAEPMLDDYRVTVLDVGQGQSVLLQSRGSAFLVDCGGEDDADAADHVAQVLLSQGITRLDGLILTHYDRDHAGGVEYLARRIAIDRLYLPGTEDGAGLLPGILAQAGDAEQIWVTGDLEIRFSGCTIRIFGPNSEKSGNESCAAVLFQSEKCDTLITGDLNAVQERALLDTGLVPDLEILVAGHHGSKTATSAELLYRAAPDIVVISVGADNSYGHPAQEVLSRLALYGCQVYRTDQMGDITFRR